MARDTLGILRMESDMAGGSCSIRKARQFTRVAGPMGKEKGMEDITTEANWSIPAGGKAESLMDMALNIRLMVANLNTRKEDGGSKEVRKDFSSNTVMGPFVDGDFGLAIISVATG